MDLSLLRRFQGSGSCTRGFFTASPPYFFNIPAGSPTQGTRVEISLAKNGNNSPLDLVINATVNGNNTSISMPRVSGRRERGADFTNWFIQSYVYEFPSSAIGEIKSIAFNSFDVNDYVDEISVSISRNQVVSKSIELRPNEQFTFNVNESTLLNPGSIQTLETQADITIGPNENIEISLNPISSAVPIFQPTCETVRLLNLTPHPTEAGGDAFDFECLQGTNPLGASLFFSIQNLTNKNYCLPIDAQFEVDFSINLPDTLRSTNYSEVFDIIAR